eukprot:11074896-Prorocentrum_lima.AAC.1
MHKASGLMQVFMRFRKHSVEIVHKARGVLSRQEAMLHILEQPSQAHEALAGRGVVAQAIHAEQVKDIAVWWSACRRKMPTWCWCR